MTLKIILVIDVRFAGHLFWVANTRAAKCIIRTEDHYLLHSGEHPPKE